jgi:hypothetical protein
MATYSIRDLGRREILMMSAVLAGAKAGVPRGYVASDVAHGFITLKSGG